jgi:hypothetical protein
LFLLLPKKQRGIGTFIISITFVFLSVRVTIFLHIVQNVAVFLPHTKHFCSRLLVPVPTRVVFDYTCFSNSRRDSFKRPSPIALETSVKLISDVISPVDSSLTDSF